MKQDKVNELLLSQIKEVNQAVHELDKKVLELGTQVEERTGKKAITISVIGGILTFAASIGAAMLMK